MNKEQLKVGDCLRCTVDNSIIYVRKFNNKTLGIINSKNQKDSIPYEALEYYKFANPIIDNRIVDSKTFAVRFKQFLDWVPKEFYMSGPHILEEYEYMQIVADQLLKYQIQTATNKEEIDYLKRLELI